MIPGKWPGLAGVLCILVGPFCPLIKIPFQGAMNLHTLYPLGGNALLLVALAGLFIVLLRKAHLLPAMGLLALSILIVSYVDVRNTLLGFGDDKTGFFDQIRRTLARSAVQHIQYQWGLAVLAAGVLLLLTSGRFQKNTNQAA